MVFSDRRADTMARPCSAWPGAAVLAFPATQALRWLPDWIMCSTMADILWNVKAICLAILHRMSSSSSDRPRLTRKGAETRARIVDAAAGLIFQQGVARTTIEEVRDGAHVS